jgi:hypothetical protein
MMWANSSIDPGSVVFLARLFLALLFLAGIPQTFPFFLDAVLFTARDKCLHACDSSC